MSGASVCPRPRGADTPAGESPDWKAIYSTPASVATLRRLVHLATVAVRAQRGRLVFLTPGAPLVIDSAGLAEQDDLDRDLVRGVAEQGSMMTLGSFVGIPILSPGGQTTAVLSVSDGDAREWTSADRSVLEEVGMTVRALVERDAALREREQVDTSEHRQLLDQVRSERELLVEVLRQMPAGVLIHSPEGQVIMSNPQFEELVGTPQSLRPEEWPWGRSPTGGDAVRGEIIDFLTTDGRPATARVNWAPLRDSHGNIVAGVATLFDVTDQRAAERRLLEEVHETESQHRVGQSLVAELDLERLVQTVLYQATRLCGAQFGSFFYYVSNGEGPVLRRSTLSDSNVDPLAEVGTPQPAPLLAALLRGEGPFRVADVTTDRRFQGMPLPVRSCLAVPVLGATGDVKGALIFAHSAAGVFTRPDERTIEGIATQTAVALDNARLYREAREAGTLLSNALEQERRVLTALAESFLGRQPQIPGLDISCIYRPARLAERMGGDFYDFIRLDGDRLGIVIGDVCGKGLAAGIYTAATKYFLRAYANEGAEPHVVLTSLNRALCREMNSEENRFVTLFFGVLDMKASTLTYANAGHTSPLLHRSCSGAVTLEPTGPILGVFRDAELTFRTEPIPEGSTLVLFTDGITEAGSRLGPEPWKELDVASVLESTAGRPAADVAQAVFEEAQWASAGDLCDDVAVVVTTISPSQPLPPGPGPGP